jgi:hypothetical protein
VPGELELLERDVAQARRRLHDDLANLRGPGLVNFKNDLSTSAENLLTDLKDRAAANPVATAAIGAGIAWRLVHRPPVASLLVGYGIYSLFRTDPRQPTAASRYAAEAAEAGARLAGSAAQAASDVRAAAASAFSTTRAAASETMDALTAQAAQAGASLSQAGADAGASLTKGMSDARDAATRAVHDVGDAATRAVHDVGDRVRRDKDAYLLGFAAAALAAAIGISAKRADRRRA